MTTGRYDATELDRRIEAITGEPMTDDDRIDDRLAFDFGLMPTRRWAQIDTTETTAGNWYGMWTNRFQRRILIYAEGDISDTMYADDAEYAEGLRAITEKELAKDTWIGIATYPEVEAQLVQAGAGDVLEAQPLSPGTSGNLVKPCRSRPQPRAPNASTPPSS